MANVKPCTGHAGQAEELADPCVHAPFASPEGTVRAPPVLV